MITTIMKRYPNTKLQFDSENNISIIVNGVDLMEEHLLPPTKDPDEAWKLADISLKMTQNINRTHPLRIERHHSEDTKDRINNRKKNSRPAPEPYMSEELRLALKKEELAYDED